MDAAADIADKLLLVELCVGVGREKMMVPELEIFHDAFGELATFDDLFLGAVDIGIDAGRADHDVLYDVDPSPVDLNESGGTVVGGLGVL